MADPFSLISSAIETAKKLRDIAQKVKNAETSNLVADLMLSLADLKTELATMKDERLRLQQEVKRLSERPDVRANTEVRDGLYYLKEPMPGRPPGPYCPRCFDVDDRMVPLTEQTGHFQVIGKWRCPQCKQPFGR